jgi:UDP-N-acetylmuramyl pentapeptide phosphotransferase/UDP-N-acetylglucosamine-1-phosphate transferase
LIVFAPLVAFVVSFIICCVCIDSSRRMGLGLETSAHSVRRFHVGKVSRLGGLGIALGLGAALIFANMFLEVVYGKTPQALYKWFVVIAPVFLFGIAEDLTHKVGATARLVGAFLSALLAAALLSALVPRLDIPLIDGWFKRWPLLSVMFSALGMAGVSHATNLIDGYNGLSGMVTLMILCAVASVAWQVGDMQILLISLACAGGVAGFLVLNYPRGRIMAGDGGAYLMGFIVALLAVLLVARNRSVSPWFCLALAAYPVFETLFSMYRRVVWQSRSPGEADALHMHQLIHRKWVRPRIPLDSPNALQRRNAATSPYLWLLAACSIVPACWVWDRTLLCLGLCLVFAVVYVTLYLYLLRSGFYKTKAANAAAEPASTVSNDQ